MATVNKDFKVKNGLVVEGTTGTINGHDIITEAIADAKGDILVASGADAIVRLGIGTDGQVLTAASGASNGLQWSDPAAVGVFGESITFEGTTANAFETTLSVTDPTADNTITFPDATGTVALTSDLDGYVTETGTQELTNKTYNDPTLKDRVSFTDNSDTERMYIEYSGTGATRFVTQDDLSIRSQDGDIILYPGSNNQWGGDGGTGKVYINWGNDATDAAPENEVATHGYVDNIGTRDNTVNTVLRRDGFGNAAIGQLDAETKFTAPDYRVGSAGQVRDLDGDLQVSAYDANTLILRADADVNITGDSFVTLNANDGAVTVNATGNIDLYPGTGNDAYVNEDTIITSTATQEISNKTVVDELYFRNTATSSQDGVVVVNNATEDFEITANTADLNLKSTTGHVNITSTTGDVTISADGAAYYGSASAENELATHGYVDNAISGLDWKQAVNLLWNDSNATITGATGTLVIDGHTALTTSHIGYRILITTGANRGIWEYADDNANWTLTRPADADAYSELIGAAVYVMEGTQFGSTSWVQGNHYSTSFTDEVWTQFSGQGSVTSGTGIVVDGLEVSVDFDVVASQTDLSTGLGTKQDTLTEGTNIDITGSTISVTGLASTDISDFSTAALSATSSAYDASGLAATAESNANSYTNTALESYTPTSSLETTIDGYGFAYSSEIPTSSDDLSEGTSNLFYTDSRAKAEAAALLTNATKTNITITADGSNNLTITAEDGIAGKTTDDLDEGDTNLYFTDSRAVGALNQTTPNFTAVEIESLAKQVAATVEVATASTVTAYSFAKADYRSAKFLIKTAYGTHTELTEVLLTLDSSDNIAIVEYATVGTNGSTMNVSADVDGSNNVRLRVQTLNNNSDVTVFGTLLA